MRRPGRSLWWWLAGAFAVCVYVGFILLRHFTPFPIWACLALELPAGAIVFLLAIEIAEMAIHRWQLPLIGQLSSSPASSAPLQSIHLV